MGSFFVEVGAVFDGAGNVVLDLGEVYGLGEVGFLAEGKEVMEDLRVFGRGEFAAEFGGD